jgi:hypothetical protein
VDLLSAGLQPPADAARRDAPPPANAPPPQPPADAAPHAHSRRPAHQLEGRITGPHASAVVAVIVLGPDTLLREAARVAPARDGSWFVDGLLPGRYRVQLDGGARVLGSAPAFVGIDVHPSTGPHVATFEVLRVH